MVLLNNGIEAENMIDLELKIITQNFLEIK